MRSISTIRTLILLTMTVFIAGCPSAGPMTPNDDTGGMTGDDMMGTGDGTDMGGGMSGGGMTDDDSVVRTSIAVHEFARIGIGDGIIVFGTSGNTGVDYVVPSAGDTEGRGIPDGGTFVADAFAVAGSRIALVNGFEVTIFDTATQGSRTLVTDDIRLASVPNGLYDPGHLQADGNLVAVRNNFTDDGNFVKVINITGPGASNAIISFDVNPGAGTNPPSQLAIDADERQLVAILGDNLFLYDIDAPDQAPQLFSAESLGGIAETQIGLHNGFVIFHADDNNPTAFVLNTRTSEFIELEGNPAAGSLIVENARYGYFSTNADGPNGVLQSVIGLLPAQTPAIAVEDDFVNRRDTNDGLFGFGSSMAVTDGGDWYIAGRAAIDVAEMLMVSDGGRFETVEDPANPSERGIRATDVVAGGNVVAFKVGNGTDTRLGYRILQE